MSEEAVYELLTDNLIDHKKHVFKVIRDILYPIIAIVIPLTICFVLFKTNDFYPFTESGNTILMIDGSGQYIAYFRYFKTLLDKGGSFLYTLSKTFGGDFLSLYAYYLASPLNFLIVFFSYENIPLFMLVVAVIKMALASLCMYLMLRFMNKQVKISYLIFAISYGLCSYCFVYMFTPMWLDAVMVLPLVVLGIHKLIRKENVLIYPLSLFYTLICSWYIGFMVCIFAVFFFFTQYFILRVEKDNDGKRIYTARVIGRFILLSLLGGLLAAFIWLSAIYHFQGTKAGFSFSYDQGVTMNLESLLSGFLTNGYQEVGYICDSYHYMAAFTSTPALALAILYFFSKEYKLRERMSYLVLFLIYILLTAFTVPYTLMHGGSVPTWFPTRYSFIFCFLVCLFGDKGYSGLKKTPLYAFLAPLLIGFLAVYLVSYVSNSHGDTYQLSKEGAIIFICTVVIGFIIAVLYKLKLKRAPAIASLAASVIIGGGASYSIYLGASNIIKVNEEGNTYLNQEQYLEGLSFQSDVDHLSDYDSSLYRMENTFMRPYSYNDNDNDPMFYGYNGMTHFSSVEKRLVMSYLEKIGFFYNGFSEGYDTGSTVSMNAYLGIKYLIDDNKQSTINFLDSLTRLPLESQNDMTFYENQYALPLAMTIKPNDYTYVSEGSRRKDGSIYWYDHFEYQNEIFKTLTDKVVDEDGNKKDIFKKIEPSSIVLSAGLTSQETQDGTYYTSSGDYSSITYRFQIPEEAKNNNLYFMFKDRDGDLNIYLDNKRVDCMSYWHAGISSFEGEVGSNHTLRVSIPKKIENYRVKEEIYYEDLSVLQEYIDAIKEDGVTDLKEVISPFTYKIEGKLNLTDNNKYLFFTLPYQEGVSIYVDGRKMNTVLRMNIFTACDLSSLTTGEHDIAFVYSDGGFNIGLVISALSLMGLISYACIFYKRARKNDSC